jgi:TolB-like protein
MFTDIVGYTALMAESEERGLRARSRHRELVRPLVERFRGDSIEARGDESLSLFPSALDAVNCALAIADAVEEESDLRLHVGIHLGDVVLEAGEVSGDGVNIARRICSLTEGGGICLSEEVYQAIRNRPEIEATSLGERELRNVGRPVRVYALDRGRTAEATRERSTQSALRAVPGFRTVLGWATAVLVLLAGFGAWWWSAEGTSPGPIRSLAVLPLDNLSGDPEQEYFADGMTEALIGDIAGLGSLRVISRTSVMRYKGVRRSLPDIARELNVDAIVEGSVMWAGDAVRITAQLIDARSDSHLWAGSYERELRDILALQKQVAQSVTQGIRQELSDSPPIFAQRDTARPVDDQAYTAFLQGGLLLQRLTAEDHRRGVQYLEEAVVKDPTFAPAWGALAIGYT